MQEKHKWETPKITEFISIKELLSLGLLLIFFLIATYPGKKNQILLFLNRKRSISIKWEKSKVLGIKKTSTEKLIKNLLAKGDYSSALKIIERKIFLEPQSCLYWLKRIKKLSLSAGRQKDLIQIYFEIFKKIHSYNIRKYLFIEIVKLYQSQKNYKSLKKFLSLYYKEFLKDTEMDYFILKTALSLGDTKFSEKIALSIKELIIK